VVKHAAANPLNGDSQHEWIDLRLPAQVQLSLFLGAARDHLELSMPSAETAGVWPLDDMAGLAADPENVAKIVDNWRQHAEAYTEWTNEADHLRWHRFGCGNFHATESDGARVEKRVANTKELPGLDRTDDIKKGAAQVLKYSRLKFDCRKRALRAVLLGNTHALTHHDDYVAPLINLKVLDSAGDQGRTEWIFDAMIGLTQDHFNAQDLRAIFAFDRLLDNTAAGTL